MSQTSSGHLFHRFHTTVCVLLLALSVGWAPMPAFAADPASTTSTTDPTTTTDPTQTTSATDPGTTGTGGGGGSTDEWNTDVLNSPLTLPGAPLWETLRGLLSFGLSSHGTRQN